MARIACTSQDRRLATVGTALHPTYSGGVGELLGASFGETVESRPLAPTTLLPSVGHIPFGGLPLP